MKKWIAILLALLMITTSAFTLLACNDDSSEEGSGSGNGGEGGGTTTTQTAPEGTVTRMTVDINPSVEFIVDDENKVVSVTALNDDGSILLAGEVFVGLTPDAAAQKMVTLAKELGYLAEGTAEDTENDVEVSVSGDSEYAQKLLTDVKNSVSSKLSELDINAAVKSVDAMAIDALRAYVLENTSLTEEEVSALDEKGLMTALSLSRIETAEFLTNEMRSAYLEAKNYEISVAEMEAKAAIMEENLGAIGATVMESYNTAIETYRTAVQNVEDLRYTLLVAPESDYQMQLSALRDKKAALLEAKAALSELDPESAAFAEATAAFELAESKYNEAYTLLEDVGASANSACDMALVSIESAKAQLDSIYNMISGMLTNLETLMTENAAAIAASVNTAKDEFFTKFETAHAEDISKMEEELLAKKQALIDALKNDTAE